MERYKYIFSFLLSSCRQFIDIFDGVSFECISSGNNNGSSCGLLSDAPEEEGIPEA